MWSSGLEGNLDVVGMEKAFCRTAKQSIYLGVTSKDPFLRGMFGMVSECISQHEAARKSYIDRILAL